MLHNKKSFAKGVVLLASFAVIFAVIMSPVFKDVEGKSINGLEYSDDLFNKLSKGSSYFIPAVKEKVGPLAGKNVDVTFKLKKAESVPAVSALASVAGVAITDKGGELTLSGDLGKMLGAVVQDSDDMYHNDGKAVSGRYNMPEKKVMESWFELCSALIKPMQKAGLIKEAQAVDTVLKRAVEPGYNFYGIIARSVSEKIPTVVALLSFYVIYTLWYGFAIFEIFDGIGLSMKKSKVKEEV